MHNVLVISGEAASGGELGAHLGSLGPCRVTVLLPKGAGTGIAERLRAMDLCAEVLEGPGDALRAGREECARHRYDEIVVQTLPSDRSAWLARDLPFRLQSITGTLVTHLVERPLAA